MAEDKPPHFSRLLRPEVRRRATQKAAAEKLFGHRPAAPRFPQYITGYEDEDTSRTAFEEAYEGQLKPGRGILGAPRDGEPVFAKPENRNIHRRRWPDGQSLPRPDAQQEAPGLWQSQPDYPQARESRSATRSPGQVIQAGARALQPPSAWWQGREMAIFGATVGVLSLLVGLVSLYLTLWSLKLDGVAFTWLAGALGRHPAPGLNLSDPWRMAVGIIGLSAAGAIVFLLLWRRRRRVHGVKSTA